MIKLRAIAIAVALGVIAAPVVSQAGVPPTEHATRALTSGPASAPTVRTKAAPASLDETYAAREANAKGLETFEGGGAGIYISGGAGVVIIVLLIVLIVL